MACAAAGEKMPAVFPRVNARGINQTHVGLVDECSGIEGCERRARGHVSTSQCAQLLVDERHKLHRRLFAAGSGFIQKLGHLGRAARELRITLGLDCHPLE